MIKSINTGSAWLNVQGSNVVSSFYVDNNKLQQGLAGQIRHTGYQFEVNDGNGWKPLYENMVIVDVTEPAQQALQWALKQFEKEKELEKLAESNIAVKDAVDSYKKTVTDAEEKLKVVVSLVKETA